MKSNLKRGFTLIELLVVIAIIGILSAVVLASLNTARSKGSDAAVISDIGGIRTQAQLYQNDHAGAYSTTGTLESTCGTANTLFSDVTVAKQVTAANTANGPTDNVACRVSANGTAYAVSAELVATPGTYYCVDSTGLATTTGAQLAADATACQ